MKLTKELLNKMDLYSTQEGNIADLSEELMIAMKDNNDWPSNELTNQFEKELLSGKMILPKSNIKDYVDNLSEAFLNTFTDEPAILKLNNVNKDWTNLLHDESVKEELLGKFKNNFKSNFKFEDEEFAITDSDFFKNEYDFLELKEICEKVLELNPYNLNKDSYLLYYSANNLIEKGIITKEQYAKLESELNKILPTKEGFFFGPIDYALSYFLNVKNTLEMLTKILDNANFENEVYLYHSSW